MINLIAKLINNQYKKKLEKIEEPIKKKVIKHPPKARNRSGFVRYDDFIVNSSTQYLKE